MLKFSKDKCVGCSICEVICSMEHEGKINTKKARIRYRDDWPQTGKVEVCRNCGAKPCIKVCQENALDLDGDNNLAFKQEACTGCLDCSTACPFGELPTDGQYPLFCDRCNGAYQCINWCPTKALTKAGEAR
ncbi:4Fe-4S dicluster domain-containing protein [Desulfitibacter alkalitolerans]|uniref:4Fe-4S dicluster domain-containing protein n=1 Tax=Desulfitibacter alkalitolerans TaxID=264641 RepID=UPI00146F9811|nr:4Fe-4S dicluster domain-containing protein [Desulfitibacter alkalitolerans]